VNAHSIPTRTADPFADRDRAAEEALARFRAQWPPERCERLGRMADGDYSQVWEEALAPKDDAPADAAVRGLASDAELLSLAKGHRTFNREPGL
jgi:hypothetical protein